jgi:hypothetical protein
VRNNGHDCYLLPEFCLLDGVPDAIRKTADWINIQKTCRKRPEDKLYEITEFSQDFLNSKIFKEWGLKFEANNVEVNCTQLEEPKITLARGQPYKGGIQGLNALAV